MKNCSALLVVVKEFQVLILSIAILLSSIVISVAIISHKDYPRYTHIVGQVYLDNKTGEIKAVTATETMIIAKIEDEQ